LQLTSLTIHGCKINIINIYNSSGTRQPEIDQHLLDNITDLTTKLKYEPTIIIGDFNFDTFQPENTKTKRWIELLHNNGFHEKESNLPSYIRKDNNSIIKSRLDHLFTNNLIDVKTEESIGSGVNDHICLLFTVKIRKINSWKRTITEPLTVAKEMEDILKSSNIERDLTAINERIKLRYSKKLYPASNLFRESTVIRKIKEQIHALINSEKHQPEWKDNVQQLKLKLNQRYKEEYKQYKERWIKYINKKETKHLYKFDGWLKRKEINWNNLPNNIDLKTTYKYFQQKFSTTISEQSTTFKIPPSTIKEGPTFTKITINDVIEALKRMKSKSCGPDHISLDTIRLIDPKIIAECLNNCYSKGDIPNEWKKGYIKIIPKKDKVETLKDFRPITILNIMYRLLFNIIQKKISRWAKTNIDIRQQAFTPGRQPNNHCVLIQTLKKIYKKKGMIITNIDIAGAYDAVESRVIEMALDHAKFPADLKNFILNSYKNNEISIEWNDILSEPFKKTRGIPQGCPLAPHFQYHHTNDN